MRVTRYPRVCPLVSSGGYGQKNNTFTSLLHNTLWRDTHGHFVRQLEEAELLGLTLDCLPFVHAFADALLTQLCVVLHVGLVVALA